MRNAVEARRVSAARAASGLCLVLLGGCAPHAGGAIASSPAASGALQTRDAVLVSGWIGAEDLGLEPVLATDAAPSDLEPAGGPYRIRGMGEEGEVQFDVTFDERALASISGDATRHFAFVVPVVAGDSLAVSRIELEAEGGRRFVRESRQSGSQMRDALASDRELTMERVAGGLRIRWNAGRFPLVQLRDPRVGTVLAVGREGELMFPGEHAELDVVFSDGVRSAVTRARIP